MIRFIRVQLHLTYQPTRVEFSNRDTHLRCHIRQTPTSLRQRPRLPTLFQLENGTKTKIRYFECTTCVEQDIFGLEVAVADTLIVDVAHAVEELTEIVVSNIVSDSYIRS